jgi:hypothetical protein
MLIPISSYFLTPFRFNEGTYLRRSPVCVGRCCHEGCSGFFSSGGVTARRRSCRRIQLALSLSPAPNLHAAVSRTEKTKEIFDDPQELMLILKYSPACARCIAHRSASDDSGPRPRPDFRQLDEDRQHQHRPLGPQCNAAPERPGARRWRPE